MHETMTIPWWFFYAKIFPKRFISQWLFNDRQRVMIININIMIISRRRNTVVTDFQAAVPMATGIVATGNAVFSDNIFKCAITQLVIIRGIGWVVRRPFFGEFSIIIGCFTVQYRIYWTKKSYIVRGISLYILDWQSKHQILYLQT